MVSENSTVIQISIMCDIEGATQTPVCQLQIPSFDEDLGRIE